MNSNNFKNWLKLARFSFHIVGFLPFILGTTIAYKLAGSFDWPVFILAVSALSMILIGIHFANECFDYKEDCVSSRVHNNRFAGGSGVMPTGVISQKAAFIGAMVCLFVAGLLGLVIQFGFKTGPLTVILGALGMIGGFFYSVPPFRWSSKGLGEIWIAFCYGPLPVITALYLFSGQIFNPIAILVSLPIAAAIISVILINEYPDYPADEACKKRNLLVRIGQAKGAYLFALLHILSWFFIVLSVFYGVPKKVLLFYIPVFLLSAGLSISVLRGMYKEPEKLQCICGLNILVNVGTNLAYIAAFVFTLQNT